MKRAAVLPSVALLVVLWLGPAALAQTYPPTQPTVGVNDATVPSGGQVTVSGDNWLPGSDVSLTVFSGSGISLGSAHVGPDGTFTKTVTLDVLPGTHTIVVSGKDASGARATASVTVQVLAAGVTTAGTGADIGLGLVLAIALLLAGVAALVAGRRRASRG